MHLTTAEALVQGLLGEVVPHPAFGSASRGLRARRQVVAFRGVD